MSLSPASFAPRSRGMRDLLPADMRAFRRVTDAFRSVAGRWGYEEIRTPTLETYSLFTEAGTLTPQMLSRVYSFLDWDGWSGERVVLRPDSTIPVARLAAEGGLDLPARLYYVQNVFRFVPTGDREEWQCGIEYLGAPDRLGDLEVAVVGSETLQRLGFDPVVRLGHVGVSRSVAEVLNAAGKGELRALLDLAAEGGLGALRPALNGDAQLGAFVEVALQATSGPALLENLEALAGPAGARAHAAITELSGVARALAASGRKVVIDLGMPRDFEYYTGVVFELEADGGIWGRGGRYAISAQGEPISACGVAIEGGLLATQLAPSGAPRRPVSVIPDTAADMGRALDVAQALHRAGIAAALESGDSTLAVRVSASGLLAHTPEGDRQMTALDDLVGLLVQYK